MTTVSVEHRDLSQARATQQVIDELPQLHARARAHWGPPLDVAAIVRDETQRRRIRFVGGGGASSRLDLDELDAIVHAAEHGYRTCGRNFSQGCCWLPEAHDGDCCGDMWRWRLLYGQDENAPSIMIVCAACTPHRWVPRPADCRHGTVTR